MCLSCIGLLLYTHALAPLKQNAVHKPSCIVTREVVPFGGGAVLNKIVIWVHGNWAVTHTLTRVLYIVYC
jgi:uncharacterized membrane protein YccF (DUF307 family)